jgi:hypothetical protein
MKQPLVGFSGDPFTICDRNDGILFPSLATMLRTITFAGMFEKELTCTFLFTSTTGKPV